MPISFDPNVPQWMRRMCRRWARVIGFEDWRIEVSRTGDEEMTEAGGARDEDAGMVAGLASVMPEYLSAHIQFNEELAEGEAEDYVVHELLHLHLAPFELLFRQLWDGRRKIPRAQAEQMLSDLIEASIQRHVRQLQRARGRKS